jgi:RNA polymerase sigma factor (TIGR02999 family)
MHEVTRILSAIEQGDPLVAEQLLPLIYGELRQLAAEKMAQENPGHTLQATALVHEAYLRLVEVQKNHHWKSRGHFFAAASEAMQRILVEHARRRLAEKHGGQWLREDVDLDGRIIAAPPEEIVAVHDALGALAGEDAMVADVVRLRYFGGFSIQEAAELLGISRSMAYRSWTYARAWLRESLTDARS